MTKIHALVVLVKSIQARPNAIGFQWINAEPTNVDTRAWITDRKIPNDITIALSQPIHRLHWLEQSLLMAEFSRLAYFFSRAHSEDRFQCRDIDDRVHRQGWSPGLSIFQ